MKTTGQRLSEQQRAAQQMLDWWGELLPALGELEARVNQLDPDLPELKRLRALLARASTDVATSNE